LHVCALSGVVRLSSYNLVVLPHSLLLSPLSFWGREKSLGGLYAESKAKE